MSTFGTNTLAAAIAHGRYQLQRALDADYTEARVVRQWLETLLEGAEAALAGEWRKLSEFQFGTEERHECEPGDEYPFEIVVSGACEDIVRVLDSDGGAYDAFWVVDKEDGEGPGWFVSDGDDICRLRVTVVAWRPRSVEPELPAGWTP